MTDFIEPPVTWTGMTRSCHDAGSISQDGDMHIYDGRHYRFWHDRVGKQMSAMDEKMIDDIIRSSFIINPRAGVWRPHADGPSTVDHLDLIFHSSGPGSAS